MSESPDAVGFLPSAKVPKPDEVLQGLTRPYKVPLGLANITRSVMPRKELALPKMVLEGALSGGFMRPRERF
jgi:hypothetical protein